MNTQTHTKGNIMNMLESAIKDYQEYYNHGHYNARKFADHKMNIKRIAMSMDILTANKALSALGLVLKNGYMISIHESVYG